VEVKIFLLVTFTQLEKTSMYIKNLSFGNENII